MEMKQLLRELCTASGVAGAEDAALQVARRRLEPFGACRVTPLGSLICTVRPAREGKPHIMLDAHLDEIGLVVTNITDDGFIKVSSCGGVDRRMLPASRLTIHAKTDITAVVASVPPHLKEDDSKKAAKIESFSVDAGLTAQAARESIQPGDRVTVDAPFRELLGDLVSCKSLDNRAGCAALIRAAELLHGQAPDCGISVALTTMEEVGGQGSCTAAYALEPTHAIVVDVSFAKCDGAPAQYSRIQPGSGAMIGFAPIVAGDMSRGLRDAAEKHGIPHTVEVMGGKTGTNADSIAITRCGVRTGMVSIPQRNMHTPAEVVSAADVEAVAQLIAAYIRDNF